MYAGAARKMGAKPKIAGHLRRRGDPPRRDVNGDAHADIARSYGAPLPDHPSLRSARSGSAALQATFMHLEIVAGCSRMPGGLRDVDLDGLTEAAWQVFVDGMREACAGGVDLDGSVALRRSR